MRAAFVVIANHLETDISVVIEGDYLLPTLADLLAAEGDFEGVVDVAAGVENTDDVTLATIHLRAEALPELDHRVAGFETYLVALARTAGRSPELLKAMRYDRALAYQETGQSRKAEADFERLLAVGPDSRDLKTRLAQSAPPASDTCRFSRNDFPALRERNRSTRSGVTAGLRREVAFRTCLGAHVIAGATRPPGSTLRSPIGRCPPTAWRGGVRDAR